MFDKTLRCSLARPLNVPLYVCMVVVSWIVSAISVQLALFPFLSNLCKLQLPPEGL